MAKASSLSCVTNTAAVRSSRRMDSTSCRMSCRMPASRLLNGSSSSTVTGWGASVRASATRCCCPPDSSCGYLPRIPGRRTSSITSATLCSRRPASRSRRPKEIFCSTVMCGNRAYSCRTMPTARRSGGICFPGEEASSPLISTWPAVGASSPAMSLRRVVLPDPLEPRIESISPGQTSKLTSRTATMSPNILVSPVHRTSGTLTVGHGRAR